MFCKFENNILVDNVMLLVIYFYVYNVFKCVFIVLRIYVIDFKGTTFLSNCCLGLRELRTLSRLNFKGTISQIDLV